MSENERRLSVLLTTEGTYPYHKGGVSTWCQALTSKLGEIDFTVMALTMHPYLEPMYELAPNVSNLVTVPLWGTEDPAEYGWYESGADFLRQRWRTTDDVIVHRFVPLYRRFLQEATSLQSRPEVVGEIVSLLHGYFTVFDYQRTMTDRIVWNAFIGVVNDVWMQEKVDHAPPSLGELAEAWHLFHRFLTVLATPIPRTD